VSAEAEAALADRLRAIPVAEMSDTLEAAGLPGRILHPDFRSFPSGGAGRRMAGPAVCLSGEASAAPGLPIRAVDGAVQPGCIVAVSPGEGCTAALVGGNMAAAWRIKGCAGLVVDGAVRDAADFGDLAVFARGASPRNCRGAWRIAATDQPLALPGATGPVTLHPGDWLHGDGDGIAVLPRAFLLQLVEDAEAVGRIERRMRARILTGEDRQAVYASSLRFAHVRAAG
jgi:regulator of RNase E activity RraA